MVEMVLIGNEIGILSGGKGMVHKFKSRTLLKDVEKYTEALAKETGENVWVYKIKTCYYCCFKNEIPEGITPLYFSSKYGNFKNN